MRNDIPCPSGTHKLVTYHAGIKPRSSSLSLQEHLLSHQFYSIYTRASSASYQYNEDVLQLPGLFFFPCSRFFAEFAGQVDEAQGLKQDRGIQGPFFHISGQIKIGILGCPAGNRTSSLTLLRVQNLVPPVVS